MSTIEEIRDKFLIQFEIPDHIDNGIYLAMKEYAEHYAIKCLQLAAKSVKSEQVMNIQQVYEPFAETRIDKNSILNIKLPEHE